MNKKFTLMELITAIVVISILAAIILLNISKVKDRALETAKIANLSEMQKIVDMYYLERDMYPTIVQPTMGPEKVEQDLLVTDFQKKKIKFEFCVKPTGEVIYFEDCETVTLDELPLPVDVLTCDEALQAGYEKCIRNQEELKSIEEGLYSRYIVVNDFNITGDWDSIVLPDINASVELNGNGYAISDLAINTTANKSGMFAESNNIIIKNLKLLNAKMNVNNHSYSGLLIGRTNGLVTIDNVVLVSEVTGAGDYVGSLIGGIENTERKSILSNVSNISGRIKMNLTSGDYVGGLIGYNVSQINNLKLEVDVKGSGENYGGAVGAQASPVSIDNKTSNIDVTGTIENNGSSTGLVFGLVSYSDVNTYTDISAEGTVIGNNITGGVFGQFYSTLKDISFKGKVSGTDKVGGISGDGNYFSINDEPVNVTVKGSISGTGQQVGGVSGSLNGGSPKGFEIDVVVTGDGQHVGGAFGMINVPVSDIVGKVVVTGKSGSVGGITGANNRPLSNVQLEGEVYGAGSYIGGISGEANLDLNDVHFEGTVTSLNEEQSIHEGLGGIAGKSNSGIEKASFKGSIVANESRVGGIVGENNSNMKDVTVEANISSTNGNLGGIAGYSNYLIENANFNGEVKSTYGNEVGGIAGRQSNQLINTSFTGKVTSAGDYTGGLVGYNTSMMNKVTFNGDIVSKGNHVGGIAGASYGSSPKLLGVVGTIQAEGNYVGGIFGETPYGPESGYVIATITNTGNYTGGILGKTLTPSIGKVYFSGTITGGNYVDPIIAEVPDYAYEDIKNNPNAVLYWNSDLYTGSNLGLGSGKTDAQLKDVSTFTGWDFENTWVLDGYLKFK